ncbi:MAG: T9SS type A sorting domain-containing protein [Flavobacteriales bacterium]|nr:T9SS type A sorting domain-containing protein [Flavobacteriales bacterium]MCC6938581.1 T9SS type A sorting domain-containing protein [Flavobacteriales bacterium]
MEELIHRKRFRKVRRRRWPVLLVLAMSIVVLAGWTADVAPANEPRYHGDPVGRGAGIGLVSGENEYFIASGNCYGCHGIDTMGVVWANHDAQGRDVNVPDAWRSTMMGNSARDPFWLAKVSHEVTVNPDHAAVLEDRCTACHAPLGRHNKHMVGGGLYSVGDLAFDLLGQDGVSCMACHKQRPDSLGLSFSGDLHFEHDRIIYGPFDEVFTGAMQSFLNIEPRFGAHINHAALCGGCHTLITNTVDLDGELSGDHFVEQATYHEWLNSIYGNGSSPANAITCQGCHVPRTGDGIVLAALYDWLTPRSPFGEHHMAGANVFMLELLKNNLNELGLTASSTQFDTTVARTTRMLQQNTLIMETSIANRDADTAWIDVDLINLAGHRFPSGYPSRRAFIELLVLNQENDTLFQSGRWNGAYEVIGHDPEWEPHHDVITSPDQAQIYEMVMGDVNGNKTTVLERAKEPLKDNRLAPLGFTSTHYAYDTTGVFGVPIADVDWNRTEAGDEGSGADITHYHVPMSGYTGAIRIEARVWYQSAPPRWMEEMFDHNTPAIDTFRTLFQAADGTPVLVKETVLLDPSLAVDDLRELGVRIFPDPATDGTLWIDGLDVRTVSVELRSITGALVSTYAPRGQRLYLVVLPDVPGNYLLIIRTRDRSFVRRIVRP